MFHHRAIVAITLLCLCVANFSNATIYDWNNTAGGTYSTAAQTCDAPAVSGKKAAAMCDAHGGTYMADLQVCEVEGTK